MRDIYAEVTNRIISRLDEGVVPWRKPWNAAPMNYVSRRAYRGINVWLLDSEYESRYWLTYRQARGLGGHVMRGQHGTQIVYWNIVEKEVDEEMRRIPLLRCYTVFNIEQCDGIEVDTTPVEVHTSAEEVISGYDSPPQIRHGGNRAAYIPAQDTIHIPHRSVFESVFAYYSTLFHELVHSTGHKSRLDRILDTHFASEDYSQEELVAEMGAAYLCAMSDTELVAKSIDNMAAYIHYWQSRLSEDRRLIIHISSQAQRAADWVRNIRPSGDTNPPERK